MATSIMGSRPAILNTSSATCVSIAHHSTPQEQGSSIEYMHVTQHACITNALKTVQPSLILSLQGQQDAEVKRSGLVTHRPDDLGAWVEVLVHSVTKAEQLLTLCLHTLQEACTAKHVKKGNLVGTPISNCLAWLEDTPCTGWTSNTPARQGLDDMLKADAGCIADKIPLPSCCKPFILQQNQRLPCSINSKLRGCYAVSSATSGNSLGMFSTLPMRCSMRSTASLAPPCRGPYSAPTAPATAV